MKKIIILLIFITPFVNAKRFNYEKVYQKYFAEYINGKIEYVLQDKTRIDVLTNEYAIEVDFADKWSESIGQALYYSIRAKKLPGILLIIESEKDLKYLKRLLYVAKKYKIKVWIINNNFEVKEYGIR